MRKKDGGFSKLLRVCTTLIFFLSISILDVQASEVGKPTRFGTDFIQQDIIYTAHAATQPQVKGYAVTMAQTTSNVPSAPTLSGQAVSSTQIYLTWGASTSNIGIAYYRVLKSSAVGQNYSVLTSITGTNYTDNAVVAGTTYYYTVEVFDTAGGYNRSIDLTVTTPASTQCAAAGLRADTYGGPNHVCCSGLILEGGVCNVPATNHWVSNLTTSPSGSAYGSNGGGILSITADYNYQGSTSYAGPTQISWYVNSNLIEVQNLNYAAAPIYSGVARHISTDLWTNVQPGTYTVKAVIDSNNVLAESSETDNTLTAAIVVGTTTTTQCAAAGLQANVYGGPNGVCCTGLVLQGGICNLPTQTTVPDLTISNIEVRPRVNIYDATDKYEIAVTVKNNSAIEITNAQLFKSTVLVTAGTNTSDIEVCGIGGCQNAGNAYNASMYLSAPSVVSIPAFGTQTYVFNHQNYLLSASPSFKDGEKYTIKAIVDDNSGLTESDETNNTLKVTYSNPKQSTADKIIVCHKTSSDKYEEISTDQNGWINGHSKHDGDYIKTGTEKDGPPIKPVLKPLPSDDKDKKIQELLERIAKLEFRLSDLEKNVIEREKDRETIIDQKLTERLKGKLLIQPQENGEVWYLDPVTKQKFYLKDGDGAYQALRAFGVGISEKDFTNLATTNKTLRGKVILRVQAHGEAYYIDANGNASYLKDGTAAYEIMRSKALGVSNTDLGKIATGSLDTSTSQ